MPKPLDPTGLAGAFAQKGPPSALDFLVPQRPSPPPVAKAAPPPPRAKAAPRQEPKAKPKAKDKPRATPTPKPKAKAKPRARRTTRRKKPEPVYTRDGDWAPAAPVPAQASFVRRTVRRLIGIPARVVTGVVARVF